MSIEDAVKELTAAIKELTVTIGSRTQQFTEVSATPSVSLTAPLNVPEPPTTTPVEPSTSNDPNETLRSTSKTKSNVKEKPETSPLNAEPPATYADAAMVLIAKDKTARQALVKSFKGGAVKLAELADLGDDIWARVIEAAKDLPEKT